MFIVHLAEAFPKHVGVDLRGRDVGMTQHHLQAAQVRATLVRSGTRERQELVLVRRKDGEIHEQAMQGECTFVPLLGRFAWASETSEDPA